MYPLSFLAGSPPEAVSSMSAMFGLAPGRLGSRDSSRWIRVESGGGEDAALRGVLRAAAELPPAPGELHAGGGPQGHLRHAGGAWSYGWLGVGVKTVLGSHFGVGGQHPF